MAERFVDWLGVDGGAHWLDVGCGTGALSAAVCARAAPAAVAGCDPSPDFVAEARAQTLDSRASFAVAEVGELPRREGGYDAAVSGLVLNFLPDPRGGVREMASRTRSGGVVAAYVWDYARRMELIRYFWDVAVLVDPEAAGLHEGRRFAWCRPEWLVGLWEDAGLEAVDVRSLETAVELADFEEYWTPFLGGAGAAPSYVASLDEQKRDRLRRYLKGTLPMRADGHISLNAGAWAVRGVSS